ncbi:MAG: hypothetical protein J5U19_12935 [Candidatus Methanoperedens sp.]|nr:hypothetical protein [Candidatus Methanoperedens sp.]
MRKFLLAILLLYITLLATGNANALENGVVIPLVADSLSDNGEVGSYINAQVIVTNGTGHVFVDTNPFTQVDLQGSARIAAMVASDVLGVDEKSYDFYYIIEIDSPVIGGPSAGGALTVATIAAMNNWPIKSDIAMTGMIDPDETIGPVGGIPFKLEAAASHNTTLFLVPQGQLIVNITNTTTVRRGPFITTQSRVETVDLNQLGKKLNVTVKEVGTIQDAVLEFTGHDISKPSINQTVFSTEYLKLLEPLAMQLKNESRNMYNQASFIQNDLIKNAEDSQNRADGLVNDKKYYAATSLYFASMVNILTAQWDNEYNQEKNKDQFLANITNIVEKQIQNSENDLNKSKSGGISDVEVIGAAESRITEANNILENVNNLNNANDIISSLAFAYERARSAQWWLTLAVPTGKIIPDEILKERSGWYLSQSQSISTYTDALITESGGRSTGTLTDTTLIQKEIARGYYSGALFDSLQTISRLSTAIGLLGVKDPSTRVKQSAGSAQDAIIEVRSKGIEPTLAVSAFEYGGTLTNPFNEIVQYTYSKMIAKTTESLYSRALPGSNQTVLNPKNISTISNISTTTTKKTPAFEAIILIAVLLLLRLNYKMQH